MEIYIFHSKIGNIKLNYSNKKLQSISSTKEEVYKNKPSNQIKRFITNFLGYLDGQKPKFKISYQLTGTTFQKRVLNEILNVKYGETISYKELSFRSGYLNAFRAVGTVCKNNKLPIIIPCHRIIKSSGEIGNYSLGNSIKSLLLNLERDNKKD